jgi:hypothetical protein
MMTREAKSKHEVLKTFSTTLTQHNPMQCDIENPLEYEAEALSILSRFTEAALHLSDDDETLLQIASAIVRQALEFWFDNVPSDLDLAPLSKELLEQYRSSFGRPVIQQVTIG